MQPVLPNSSVLVLGDVFITLNMASLCLAKPQNRDKESPAARRRRRRPDEQQHRMNPPAKCWIPDTRRRKTEDKSERQSGDEPKIEEKRRERRRREANRGKERSLTRHSQRHNEEQRKRSAGREEEKRGDDSKPRHVPGMRDNKKTNRPQIRNRGLITGLEKLRDWSLEG